MSTIKQRTKLVRIQDKSGERDLAIHRFAWKAAGDFVASLARYVGEVIPSFNALRAAAGSTADLPAILGQVPVLITSSDTLVKELLTGTTELTREAIDALEFVDVLQLVAAALELNYDEETKNCFAGAVAQVLGAAGFQRTKSGASSTPTSSTPATAPTT